jgi:hypothetical protein
VGRRADELAQDKAHGKKRIDWNDMAVQFETRFGLHRNHNSMRCKRVKMSTVKMRSAREIQLARKKRPARSQPARKTRKVSQT